MGWKTSANTDDPGILISGSAVEDERVAYADGVEVSRSVREVMHRVYEQRGLTKDAAVAGAAAWKAQKNITLSDGTWKVVGAFPNRANEAGGYTLQITLKQTSAYT